MSRRSAAETEASRTGLYGWLTWSRKADVVAEERRTTRGVVSRRFVQDGQDISAALDMTHREGVSDHTLRVAKRCALDLQVPPLLKSQESINPLLSPLSLLISRFCGLDT